MASLELTWHQEQALVRESKKRIPDNLRMFTFFSDYDLWNYEVVLDHRLCNVCLQHEDATYSGNGLRALFPYLAIVDQGLILPNVHPNCRCRLHWSGSGEGRRANW